MSLKAIAPDKPFFLYYAPGAAHRSPRLEEEWADQFKGQFDMGYEAMREQTLARQKRMDIVPADAELPPINPIGTSRDPQGPQGPAIPAVGRHQAVQFAVRRGEAALRADGRGIRRIPQADADHRIGGLLVAWRSPGNARTRW